jgi:hypothetical protein
VEALLDVMGSGNDHHRVRWAFAFALLCGCAETATTPARGVRQSDLAAWRDAPLIKLETQPLFSALPVTRRRLSDGSELWDYTNCRSDQSDQECTTRAGAFGAVNTTCSGGGKSTTCCHNQFVVRGASVESYRPVGRCYTDCTTRPGGVCGPSDERSSRVSSPSTVDESPALVSVRRAPRVPELGATLPETRVLCEQQHGAFTNDSSSAACRVGRQLIFACALDQASRADRCDGYYEAADVVTSRQALEAKLGLPPKESLSPEGFRVFEWANGNETVSVTMYAKGVRMTHTRRATAGEASSP